MKVNSALIDGAKLDTTAQTELIIIIIILASLVALKEWWTETVGKL